MGLFDMHCHLDFAPNAARAAAELSACEGGAFSCTVTPGGFDAALKKLSSSGVAVGTGLHPWWLSDGSCTIEDAHRIAETARKWRFIGEVGLDFGKQHVHSQELQIEAFRIIMEACSRAENRVISIHTVRSAQTVLDVIEQADAASRCACILHWYSGPSDQLVRAVRMGCYFSIGSFMMDTKRGREYVKSIPKDRMLLETDYPPAGDAYDVEAMQAQLDSTAKRIASIVGDDRIPEYAYQNSVDLLRPDACRR